MYPLSAQGVDERMINLHYDYYYYYRGAETRVYPAPSYPLSVFSNQKRSPSLTRYSWSMMMDLKSGPGPADVVSSMPPTKMSILSSRSLWRRRVLFTSCTTERQWQQFHFTCVFRLRTAQHLADVKKKKKKKKKKMSTASC